MHLKKKYGQHFLKDQNHAGKIADALTGWGVGYKHLLEIGPGGGILTQFLSAQCSDEKHLTLVEIDEDLIENLIGQFASGYVDVKNIDFLKFDLNKFESPFGVIGNFPYNISSQILFKVLEHRQAVCEVVGMFQKEVAQRVLASHGNKTYGILSVLIQAYYKVEPVFALKPGAFNPPPKVDSMVIRLEKYRDSIEGVDDADFMKMVKAAFGQRRKTLRNALANYLTGKSAYAGLDSILRSRAEQLSPAEFIDLNRQLNGR